MLCQSLCHSRSFEYLGTFFEQTLGQDRASIFARVLEIQTEAYGYIDVPALTLELNYYKSRDALDIGIGNGSFLFKIAAQNPNVCFLGIEQNDEFLSMAQSLQICNPDDRFYVKY